MRECKCCGSIGKDTPLISPYKVGEYEIITWDLAKEEQIVKIVNREQMVEFLKTMNVEGFTADLLIIHLDEAARRAGDISI